MPVNNNVIIHVGSPKTATTFLQECVFPDVGGVSYLGRRGKHGAIVPLGSAYCRADELSDIEHLDRAEEAFLNELPESERSVLVSFEDFSCVRTAGQNGGTRGERLCGRDVVAVRLRKFFPNARVIIVTRAHAAVLRSFYWYMLGRNEMYISPSRWFSDNSGLGGMIGTFDFGHLVKQYDSVFGKERVLVLPYEWLSQDCDRFFHDLIAGIVGPNNVMAECARLNLSERLSERVNAAPPVDTLKRYILEASRGGRIASRLPKGLANRLAKKLVNIKRVEQELLESIAGLSDRFTEDAVLLRRLRPEIPWHELGYGGAVPIPITTALQRGAVEI